MEALDNFWYVSWKPLTNYTDISRLSLLMWLPFYFRTIRNTYVLWYIALLIVHHGMRVRLMVNQYWHLSLDACLHISTLLVFDLSAECIKFVHNGLQTLNAPRDETTPLNSSLFMELVIIIHAPVILLPGNWGPWARLGQCNSLCLHVSSREETTHHKPSQKTDQKNW